jgi:hypothetical protein
MARKRYGKKRINNVQYAIYAAVLLAGLAIIGVFVVKPLILNQHQHKSKPLAAHRHSGKGPSIVTNKKAYYGREPIIVRFYNTNGSRQEWISIAEEGAPARLYRIYSFTRGYKNGSIVFRSLDLKPGVYEARLHYSWSTRSYAIRKRCYFRVL